jgi:hypothetical protein
MIMVLGISITSIDFFLRTPSRILQPDRTSSDHQTIVFDKNIEIPSKDFKASDFADNMPKNAEDTNCEFSECWANIVYTNQTTSVLVRTNTFSKEVFKYGVDHVPEMPHLYSAYQMYRADKDN